MRTKLLFATNSKKVSRLAQYYNQKELHEDNDVLLANRILPIEYFYILISYVANEIWS